jgi:lipoprotein NlpI
MDQRIVAGLICAPLTAALLQISAPAFGQDAGARVSCYTNEWVGNSLDLKVKGCSALIQAVKSTGSERSLAELHTNRGIAYRRKGQVDRAIAEYTAATKIDPKYAPAYLNRGYAYGVKSDLDHALADISKAVELNADPTAATENRGYAYFHSANYDAAASDFASGVQQHPNSTQNVLWLYLARARSKDPSSARTELQNNTAKLDKDKWPYPVVELYLGQKTPDATIAAAKNADERCEAQFYVGEWQLSQGNRPAAVAALKAAANDCNKGFVEYSGALAELKHQGQ